MTWLKKAEFLRDALRLAAALSEKSDSITEFFGADEIEFLDDEERLVLNLIFHVMDISDEGHLLHLEDRYYDYLFGRLDIDAMIDEILTVHAEVNPDYREVLLFPEDEEN